MIPRRERKRNRLFGYDYSRDGYYFVTICTKNRKDYFGNVENGQMVLNDVGKIAQECWENIPNHFPHVILDEYIIMPNHIHGILIFQNAFNDDVGNKDFCSLHEDTAWQTQLSRSLSSVIRGFKIGVTKHMRENNNYEFAWQKSFYDHIIRSQQSLENIRLYIKRNPLVWKYETDRDHISNINIEII